MDGVADSAASLEAFRAKQLTQIGIGAGQLEPLRAARPDMKTRLDRYAPTSCNPLFFNTRKPQFQDVRLRRAFSLATDRDGWGKTQNFGYKWESGPITWVTGTGSFCHVLIAS